MELIKTGDPDLIILDYDLPGLNGIDLCKELRKDERYKKTPIIAVTSSPIRGNKEQRFKEAGFDTWFEKPLNLQDFRKKIVNILH